MIVELLVERVPWAGLRSASGDSNFVPSAIQDLLAASSDGDAEEAYWRLDNDVVVQGQLFESARWVVGPLVAALGQEQRSFIREHVTNLLVEIAYGGPHERELAAGGDPDLAARCLDELRGGLWLYYRLLDDPVPMVRLSALDLLDAVERDRGRLMAAALSLSVDADDKVAHRARELANNGPSETA